ncbi:MAG: hypothetical protein H6707_08060 [Deltaproteobacteria bacterium]|nr:hypothetical protein [Deltaproteobacteria bacterium]
MRSFRQVGRIIIALGRRPHALFVFAAILLLGQLLGRAIAPSLNEAMLSTLTSASADRTTLAIAALYGLIFIGLYGAGLGIALGTLRSKHRGLSAIADGVRSTTQAALTALASTAISIVVAAPVALIVSSAKNAAASLLALGGLTIASSALLTAAMLAIDRAAGGRSRSLGVWRQLAIATVDMMRVPFFPTLLTSATVTLLISPLAALYLATLPAAWLRDPLAALPLHALHALLLSLSGLLATRAFSDLAERHSPAVSNSDGLSAKRRAAD